MTQDEALSVLGLKPGATRDEIQIAYRELAQMLHPDRFPDNAKLRARAEAQMRAVNEASLNETDRQDLLLMLEGFSAALDTRDTLMIKAVWLGVKKALAALKMCSKEIAAVDELLRLYLVSK